MFLYKFMFIKCRFRAICFVKIISWILTIEKVRFWSRIRVVLRALSRVADAGDGVSGCRLPHLTSIEIISEGVRDDQRACNMRQIATQYAANWPPICRKLVANMPSVGCLFLAVWITAWLITNCKTAQNSRICDQRTSRFQIRDSREVHCKINSKILTQTKRLFGVSGACLSGSATFHIIRSSTCRRRALNKSRCRFCQKTNKLSFRGRSKGHKWHNYKQNSHHKA